ncbi:hypothetical protein JYU19_00835, partial [bacterium AH-315-J21]|nr:hypothetical protein [bacterium AH-315-J21]
DGRTLFFPDLFTSSSTGSVTGSITITALTDTSMAGTFNMIMTGEVTDGDSNVVNPNFTMNITNGRFDVPIRQFNP